MMLEYEELRIRARKVGDSRYLVLASGPTVAADVVTIDREPTELRAAFDQLIGTDLGTRPRGGANVTEQLRQLGRGVYRSLFSPPLAECVSAALTQATKASQELRLRFDLPAELRDLPLEALSFPAEAPEQTLALGGRSMVRTLHGSPGARLLDPGAQPGPVHLLVAVADGGGSRSIEAGPELAALHKRLRREPAVKMDVIRGVTRAALEQWVDSHDHVPAAVLLMAHGWYDGDTNRGMIRLESAEGSHADGDPVSGELLGGTLSRARQLRLAVLSLCDGANGSRSEPFSGLAQALVGSGIPAVVAMRAPVTDKAAGLFTPDLLTAVAQNKTIDEAVSVARRHIADIPRHTAAEWASPALFLHEECRSGWLFKVTQVGDGDPADPLEAGKKALFEFQNPPGPSIPPGTVLAAALFLRTMGQWDRLLDAAQTRIPPDQRPAQLTQLGDEAQTEICWPEAERLCAMLAAGDIPTAAVTDGLGSGALVAALTREATKRLLALLAHGRQAAERDDWETAERCFVQVHAKRPGYQDAGKLLEHAKTERQLAALYATAAEHLAAGRWSAAVHTFTDLEEQRAGYRDTTVLRRYAAGRDSESQQDWSAAADAFGSCGTHGDAPARLARAQARVAAVAGQWASARDQFRAAAALGLPDDGWDAYCAGRSAEDDGDWEGAVAAYRDSAGAAGAPPDAAARLLLGKARLAIARSDWSQALVLLQQAREDDGTTPENLDTAAGLLREARGQIRQRAEEAEETGDWPTAADLFGMLPEDDTDAGTRCRYARGRAAEENENWPAAAASFTGLAYRDSTAREAYANGHRSEDSGDWADAARQYGTAGRTADAAARCRYAAGRAADEKEDWPGVIAEFGDLPDGFEDGAVRSCRNYARARTAAANGAWNEVTALLADGAAGPRASDADILCTTAAGWQARDARRWAEASDRFGNVAGEDEEFRLLRDYCAARAAEQLDDWSAAFDAYGALPGDFEDTSARRAYARARGDEVTAADATAWQALADAYAALPDGFEDSADRARHASMRRAEADGDWRTVLMEASALVRASSPGLPTSAELRQYAAGRVAEDDENWKEAETAYGATTGYQDAAARLAYTRGRIAEAAGQWEEAATFYEQAGTLPAAAARRQHVCGLLAAFPWAAASGGCELVADPATEKDPVDPYQVLRVADITLASSAGQVQQASVVLMKRFRRLTPEQRTAADELRMPSRRMRHDALRYILASLDEVRAWLATLADSDSNELADDLCRQLPAVAPLLTLLNGDVDGAITAWRQRLREAPGDMLVAHNLAVACLLKATSIEENGAWEHAWAPWEEALSCWVTVLADDAHWETWRQARAASYRHPVTPADVSRLRWELANDLAERLAHYARRHADHNRAQQAAAYQRLAVFLDIEQQGARALAEAGRLPLPDGGAIACGPAYLRSAGLAESLARRVAELAADAAAGRGRGPAELRRLRSSFSELAAAVTLGAQHRYEQALQALPGTGGPSLTDLPPDCGGPRADPREHLAGCEACGDFLRRNPAYTLLDGRSRIFRQDTVFHAVWAHLNLARTALTSGPEGLDDPLSHLAAAMTSARQGGMPARTRTAITQMLLGRAESLCQAEGASRGDRLTEGITLIERGLGLAGIQKEEESKRQLSAMLSDLLTTRGVWYSYECRDHGLTPDYSQAENDHRRAYTCNPASLNARCNFARRLVYNLPGDPTHWGRAELERIRESMHLVHDGLLQTGGNSLLLETLDDNLNAFGRYLGATATLDEITSWAEELSDDPSPSGHADDSGNRALWKLCVLIRRDPRNERLRARLLSALDDLIGPERSPE